MYTYRKWDKKSKINDLPPETVFKDFKGCENDEFFLIELDGRVFLIQNSSSLVQNEPNLETKVKEIVEEMNAAMVQANEIKGEE